MEVRRRDWAGSPSRRLGAQAVAMHFALPGVMSLLNLVDPQSSAMWQVSFALFAVVGAVGVVLLARPDTGASPVAHLGRWVAAGLYVAVAAVAVFAAVGPTTSAVDPLRVEATLLTLLLLVSVTLAVSLLFSGSDVDSDADAAVDHQPSR